MTASRAWAAGGAIAVSLAACFPIVPYVDAGGRGCTSDAGCPPGYECVDELCTLNGETATTRGTTGGTPAAATSSSAGATSGSTSAGTGAATTSTTTTSSTTAGTGASSGTTSGTVAAGSTTGGPPPADGGCDIGGVDYPAGTVDSENACQGCVASQSAFQWSPLPDTISCANGKWTCSAGVCLGCDIMGQAIGAGSLEPDAMCEACEPAVSTSAWSPAPDGTACQFPMQSCVGGMCMNACVISGQTYRQGEQDPANPCLYCNSPQSTTGWSPGNASCTLSDGGPGACTAGACGPPACIIDGGGYASGGANPLDVCQVCNPELSTSAWSIGNGGGFCGTQTVEEDGGGELILYEVCISGDCVPGCDVDGVIVDAGSTAPGQPCLSCQPNGGISFESWTVADAGAPCNIPGDAGVCTAAAICEPVGCNICGGLYPDGMLNPANPCQACVAATSQTAWTERSDGAACGAGLCSGGACKCASYLTTCGASPVDTCVDSQNCGACSNVCNAGTACFGGQCSVPAPLPAAATGLAGALGPDGRIYLAGGHDGYGDVLATALVFDPELNSYLTLPSLLTARYEPAMAGGDAGLAVVGGQIDPYTGTTVAESFSLACAAWQPLPSFPTPSGVTAGTVGLQGLSAAYGANGALFIAGGLPPPDGPSGVSAVTSTAAELLSGATAWTAVASMTNAHAFAGSAIINGLFYVAGGAAGSATGSSIGLSAITAVDVLDILHGGWSSQIAPAPVAFAQAASGASPSGLLVVAGGTPRVGSDVPLTNLQLFNPDAGAWSAGAPMPLGLWDSAGAFGLDGRFYVFGGTTLDAGGQVSMNLVVEAYDPVANAWFP